MSVRSSVHSSLDGGSKKTKPKRKEIEQDRKHKNNPSQIMYDFNGRRVDQARDRVNERIGNHHHKVSTSYSDPSSTIHNSEAGYSNGGGFQNGGQPRYQRAQGGITCQVMDSVIGQPATGLLVKVLKMRHKNELSGGHWTFMRKMLTDYSGSTEFPLVSPDEMIMESTTGDMMYKELFIGSPFG